MKSNEASSLIQKEAHEDANIFSGPSSTKIWRRDQITSLPAGFEDAAQKRTGNSEYNRLGGIGEKTCPRRPYLRNKEKPGDTTNVVKLGTMDDDNLDLEIPTS